MDANKRECRPASTAACPDSFCPPLVNRTQTPNWQNDLPTHSFKVRGALTALLTKAKEARLTGVVAASTGNHGAAVAYAAKLTGIPATIFLPNNPNPIKRDKIVGLGAKVVECQTGS